MTTASGQPTSCKPDPCELAHNDCLLGATNEVLGDFFGVTRRTIPELDRQGRAVATPWSPAPFSSAPRASARKRPAERAERAEPPCKNPACRIRRRFQSSLRALRRPVCAVRRGGNWRKPAETPGKNFVRDLSALLLSHFWGPLQTLIGVSLAEIAGIAKSVGLPMAQNSGCPPAVTNVSATNVFSPNPFKDLAGPRAIILRPHPDCHWTVTSS
jgi:hypothetical protein